MSLATEREFTVQNDMLALPMASGETDADSFLITTSPVTSKWIKQPLPDCNYPNPDDCFRWCWKETAGDSLWVMLEDKPGDIANFKFTALDGTIVIARHFEKTTVLCENTLSATEWNRLALALKKHHYYLGDKVKTCTPALREALIRFQKANQIPSGHLDYRTLVALNMDDLWE